MEVAMSSGKPSEGFRHGSDTIPVHTLQSWLWQLLAEWAIGPNVETGKPVRSCSVAWARGDRLGRPQVSEDGETQTEGEHLLKVEPMRAIQNLYRY